MPRCKQEKRAYLPHHNAYRSRLVGHAILEVRSQACPSIDMDAHHRKIELQSPSDLTYLLNNIKTAAQQKIDLAIPPSAAPEGEDAYRSKVDELVQEVIFSY